MAIQVQANYEMQVVGNALVTGILKHYRDKILGDTFKDIFQEHRSKTPSNHYVVGQHVFFEDGRVREIGAVRFSAPAVKLEPELMEKHYAWAADYFDYERNWQQVSQIMRSVIMRAKTWQDLRDMLPNYVLADQLGTPNFAGLSRTRPDLYPGNPTSPEYEQNLQERLLHWEPHLINMYARIGGTISVYVGYKLL